MFCKFKKRVRLHWPINDYALYPGAPALGGTLVSLFFFFDRKFSSLSRTLPSPHILVLSFSIPPSSLSRKVLKSKTRNTVARYVILTLDHLFKKSLSDRSNSVVVVVVVMVVVDQSCVQKRGYVLCARYDETFESDRRRKLQLCTRLKVFQPE